MGKKRILVGLTAFCPASASLAVHLKLRIIQTADVHMNLLGYD